MLMETIVEHDINKWESLYSEKTLEAHSGCPMTLVAVEQDSND